jgi:hypothetical protein
MKTHTLQFIVKEFEASMEMARLLGYRDLQTPLKIFKNVYGYDLQVFLGVSAQEEKSWEK